MHLTGLSRVGDGGIRVCADSQEIPRYGISKAEFLCERRDVEVSDVRSQIRCCEVLRKVRRLHEKEESIAVWVGCVWRRRLLIFGECWRSIEPGVISERLLASQRACRRSHAYSGVPA
jgi:hypothetical protein